jgi:hypothetical protein
MTNHEEDDVSTSSISDRAAGGEGVHPGSESQLAFDETIIEDSALEASLEKREHAKAHKQAVTKTFKQADDETKALLSQLEVPLTGEGALRVGRFRIARSESQGRAVAFETSPSERLFISPDKAAD